MKKYLFALALALATATAHAAPVPSSTTGTPAQDATIMVLGSGFGSKISPEDGSALPADYWDFEDGTQNSVDALSAGSGSTALSDQNMSVAAEARGSSTRVLKSDAINWATFANGGVVSVVLNFPDQDPGAKQFINVLRYASRSTYYHANSAGSPANAYENWKFWRGYPTSGTTYPNTIISQRVMSTDCTSGTGGPIFTVEGSAAVTVSANSIRFPGSVFMTEQYEIKYNSGDRLTDGLFRLRQDGILNLNRTAYTDDGSTAVTDDLQRIFIQDDPANLSDCGGSTSAHTVKYDDIAMDYGTYAWARVMLGNASTLAGCTILEYQPALSWSGSAIAFQQKNGGIGSTVDKYVYVFDSDGNVNSNGLLLQAGVGLPAPTGTSVNVSSGSYLGGENFEIIGTGFSGSVVRFGPNLATDVVVVSSTRITGKTPAGTSAVTVDVVVENSDGQTATFPGQYAYSRAAETPISVDDDPIRATGYTSPFAR